MPSRRQPSWRPFCPTSTIFGEVRSVRLVTIDEAGNIWTNRPIDAPDTRVYFLFDLIYHVEDNWDFQPKIDREIWIITDLEWWAPCSLNTMATVCIATMTEAAQFEVKRISERDRQRLLNHAKQHVETTV